MTSSKGKDLLQFHSPNKYALLNESQSQPAYIFKAHHKVSIIDPVLQNKPITYIIKTIIPPTLNWLPSRPNVSIKFYELLLQSTGSVFINHTLKKDSTDISFSKLVIQKIISFDDWKQSSNFQHLQSPNQYVPMKLDSNVPELPVCYQDYLHAWNNVLFQVNNDSHSWYIAFSQQIANTLPQWFFINWWPYFGPSAQIFPDEINKNFINSKLSLFQFIIKYNIPWILKWNYSSIMEKDPMSDIVVSYLVHDIHIKWWAKFDINRLSKSSLQIQPSTPTKAAAIMPTKLVTPEQFVTSQFKSFKEAVESSQSPPAIKPGISTPSHLAQAHPSSQMHFSEHDTLATILASLKQMEEKFSQQNEVVQQLQQQVAATSSHHGSNHDDEFQEEQSYLPDHFDL